MPDKKELPGLKDFPTEQEISEFMNAAGLTEAQKNVLRRLRFERIYWRRQIDMLQDEIKSLLAAQSTSQQEV